MVHPATKLALALLWPIGPLAFLVTISGLVVAAAIAFIGPRQSREPEAESPGALRLAERVGVMPDQELLGVEVIGSVWGPLVVP